jgi:hypothetical protein
MTRFRSKAEPVRRQRVPWMERQEGAARLTRAGARLARRAAGFAKPAKGRFASVLAPSRRSIPRWGNGKGKQAHPGPIKNTGDDARLIPFVPAKAGTQFFALKTGCPFPRA